jgi:hypothetical protein
MPTQIELTDPPDHSDETFPQGSGLREAVNVAESEGFRDALLIGSALVTATHRLWVILEKLFGRFLKHPESLLYRPRTETFLPVVNLLYERQQDIQHDYLFPFCHR